MQIGYARVSSADQNLDRQIDALREAGAEKIYQEKASGKDTAGRAVLKELLAFIREGDTLIVASYDRLARSTQDLLNIIETLRAKRVEFISLRERIDTGGPMGQFSLTLFAALAQFEREIISERQREGIEAAHRRGKKFGRPAAQYPDGWKSVYSSWLRKELTAADARRKLGLSKSTFYKLAARSAKPSPQE